MEFILSTMLLNIWLTTSYLSMLVLPPIIHKEMGNIVN
jgi:hypothetical protein